MTWVMSMPLTAIMVGESWSRPPWTPSAGSLPGPPPLLPTPDRAWGQGVFVAVHACSNVHYGRCTCLVSRRPFAGLLPGPPPGLQPLPSFLMPVNPNATAGNTKKSKVLRGVNTKR